MSKFDHNDFVKSDFHNVQNLFKLIQNVKQHSHLNLNDKIFLFKAYISEIL